MSRAADFAGETVDLVEVCPRDGLQNEPVLVPTDVKLQMIGRMLDAGLRHIEVTSFVNPKRVPQMADAEALCAALPRRDGTRYAGLVLNMKGYERAVATGRLHDVCAVIPVSDSFSRRNQGQTTREAIDGARAIATQARRDGLGCQLTLAVAFGCPFEGEVPVARVAEVARAIANAEPDQIVLADTIGVAVPTQVPALATAVRDVAGDAIRLRGHFHNTRNTAIANIVAGLGAGLRAFDASLGGVGGCPFAPAATGNIATEDVQYLCERMGLQTGLDLDRLIEAAHWLGGQLGRQLPGMVSRAGGFPKPAPDVRKAADGPSA
jgi:hydroxymethylglutaryl-CoA lyase